MTPATERGFATAVLTPLEWLYGAGVSIARSRRDARAPDGPARIISVGNLEAGGNGKTPFAMLLLARLAEVGLRAAYVSRAYGGRASHTRIITRVESVRAGVARLSARSRIVTRDHPFLASEIGDEGAVVAARAPQSELLFSRDKVRSAALAGESVDVVVVDDAFQTWGLRRHADAVMLDADAPFGNGHLLPAGRLREAPTQLARADWVVFNGASDREAVMRARDACRGLLRKDAVVGGLARRMRVVDGSGVTLPAGSSVFLVSGIARPAAFESGVVSLGLDVAGHAVYRDHHGYTPADARLLESRGRSLRASVLTTEKDAVKLRALGLNCAVAILDVEWVGEERLDRLWAG